ncbi:MAG: mechanosensitive ion channel domain-containing protein [Rhodospirillaceae bacterium]
MEQQANDAVEQVVLIATTYGIDILGAIAILTLGLVASGWAARATERALGRARRIDLTLQRFFAHIVRYAIIVFTVLATLQQFGVQTTSFLAVLGAAGLAIGLALQGTLSNVAAGVMLLIFRPFKIGDFVESGSISGTVDNMSLFTTELKTADGIYIVAPNSELWGKSLMNYSRNPTRRMQIVLGIDYGDDIDLAIETAQKVIAAEPRVLAEPAPQVVVGELGESSVNLYVRAWANTADYWAAFFGITRALKEACDGANITIPFPQRTLHIEGELPLPR